MSAKHTPGPWVFDGCRTIYGAPDPRSKHKNGRPAIAQLVPVSGSLRPGSDDGVYHEEDANLLTHAPDLLSALEALKLECLADPLNPCLLGWKVGKPVQHWGSDGDRIVPACSSCVARAAIAKARGVAR